MATVVVVFIQGINDAGLLACWPAGA